MKLVLLAIIIGCLVGFSVAECNDAHARQPVPIQPGQANQCWAIIGTPTQTVQCADGTWEIAREDGSYISGTGPLPAEFQPVPPMPEGPPPMSTYAPSVLFGMPGLSR